MGGVDTYDWSALGGNPVPGDPNGVRATACEFRDLADHVGLQDRLLSAVSIDSESVWTGPAADTFRARLGDLPPDLQEFIRSHHAAADALDVYWSRLRDTQELAVEALHKAITAQADIASAQALVTQAEQQTSTAADAYNRAANELPYAPDLTGALSAQLAGLHADYQSASARQWQANQALSAANASLQAAHAMAAHARAQAQTAAAVLADRLRPASYFGVAPHKRSLFGEIVHDVADAAVSVDHETSKIVSGVGRELENLGSDISSFVDYEGTHPADLAKLIGDAAGTAAGLVLTELGAGGEVLGVALDATGIGAVVGVPLDVVSAGVIAAGVATTAGFGAKSIHDLTQTAHQMRDNAEAVPGVAGADATQDGEVINFGSRTTAREGLPGDLEAAGNRFFRSATAKSRDFQAQELKGGGFRLQFFSPANNPGYGKLYVQEINAQGNVVLEYKDTIGPDGLIERKWLHGGS